MKPPVIRKAFTLVELLVVTGLMAALLGLLMTGLRSNEDTHIRQAAETLASAIRHTQTLALTNPQGAALVIVAGSGPATTSIWQGDMLPTILGTGSFSLPSPAATYGTISSLNIFNADSVVPGYQIRFSTSGISGPWGGWLGFVGTLAPATAQMQSELCQSTATTVLPAPGLVSFEIAQRPSKSQAISLPKLAAIDTRWSSIGNEIDSSNPNDPFGAVTTGFLTIPNSTSPYLNSLLNLANFAGGNADVALCFDRTGAISSIIALPAGGMPTKSYAPFKPTTPIYFLIAGVSALSSATSALDVVRSSSPIWVAVDPATGAVQSGKNQPAGTVALTGLGKSAVGSRIDAYFRSFRTNVFPAPFTEAAK